jgi:hypothetical protein
MTERVARLIVFALIWIPVGGLSIVAFVLLGADLLWLLGLR